MILNNEGEGVQKIPKNNYNIIEQPLLTFTIYFSLLWFISLKLILFSFSLVYAILLTWMKSKWQQKYFENTTIVVTKIGQGIDGSARKPALIQDTGYMVEKTYHDRAPYLVAFGAYLMPQ